VNHFESGLQTVLLEKEALILNVVDRMADNELRAVSRWRDCIPEVVQPLLHRKLEEASS